MAVVEIVRDRSEGNNSYEGYRETSRVRLTVDETRTLNYVLVSWDSEVGCGSNFGAMAQAIANTSKRPEQTLCRTHDESRPDEWSEPKECENYYRAIEACDGCAQQRASLRYISKKAKDLCAVHEDRRPSRRSSAMAKKVFENDVAECYACQVTTPGAVPHAPVIVFDERAMSQVERWADKPIAERQKILRCWRAICAMGKARSPSLIVLNALYGDRPPGLPQPGLWAKDVDAEYRRVVRYVDGSGGTGAALDDIMRVDKHRRFSESLLEFQARQKALEASRKGLLVELGRGCERLIVTASVDWRVAFRAQP